MNRMTQSFAGDNPLRWVLPTILSQVADRQGDSPWVTDETGCSLTFRQALEGASRAAGFFQALGVQRGERVAMFLSNSIDFVEAWLGLGHAGMVAVMINTELRGDFLLHQLKDSGVRFIVVEEDLLPVLRDVLPLAGQLRTVVVVGTGTSPAIEGCNMLAWNEHRHATPYSGAAPHGSDTACIMYTSGTSGPSKGVLMPHAHCTLYGIGAIKCLQLAPGDSYYICLPLFHANALLMQLGATISAGIPAFIRRRFSASRWLDDIRTHRLTVTNLIGTTSAFVIGQPSTRNDKNHCLRAVLNSPNAPQHEAALRERFGVKDVVSGFGMTEVNIPIWGRLGAAAPGAAGWTHEEHFEVQIVDPDTDLPVPAGQVGEIVVRPRVAFGFMSGYFNAPEKTVEAWRNLWFHTGDAGVMDACGLVTFIDRIKDCIRRRGENISATQVEDIVMELPGVAEVAAYAVPSDVPGGEDEVMLAVVEQPGASVDRAAVIRMAAERLPRFAAPRYIKVVPELPKTATGKVKRAVLRTAGTAGALDVQARV
jgi:crotonobetaine/carnitine-CoA ligase